MRLCKRKEKEQVGANRKKGWEGLVDVDDMDADEQDFGETVTKNTHPKGFFFLARYT